LHTFLDHPHMLCHSTHPLYDTQRMVPIAYGQQ
jgi:hypothetical protein